MNHRTVGFVCLLATLLLSAALPAQSRVSDIYPPSDQAAADLAAALHSARASGKRILLDFGGNWCTDCHVLDAYFHNSSNAPILDAKFIVVHINVGHMDANVDIAERYRIPLGKGVPAVAVLSAHGKLLYSQKAGEFESMRDMQSASVTEFLVRWTAPAH